MWAWLEEHRLVRSQAARRHWQRSNPALASALYHPRSDPAALPVQVLYMAWAFVVDDEFDDGPAGSDPVRCLKAVSGLLAVFDGSPGGNPLSKAFALLWPELSVGRSASWQNAFRVDMAAWLWTYYTEAVDRRSGRVPTVTEYQVHRRYGVDLLNFFDLAELGTRIDLPDAVRHLPAFVSLRHSGVEQIGLFNDICSARKERAAGYRHNIVFILEHHHGCTTQEAVDTANAMVTDCVHRMVAARTALDGELDAAGISAVLRQDARAAADNIIAVVRGNVEYHARSERYTDPDLDVNVGAPDYVDDLFRPDRA